MINFIWLTIYYFYILKTWKSLTSSSLRKKIKIYTWLIWTIKHWNRSHLLLEVVVKRREGHISWKLIVRRVGAHYWEIAEDIWWLTHHIRILLSKHRVRLICWRRKWTVRYLSRFFRIGFNFLPANWTNNFNRIIILIPGSSFS